MALGFGGLQFGEDVDIAGALQGISSAIGQSAQIYSQATTQVSDLAKEIANMNIDYLKQTSQQSQQLLAPFQQAGASGISALQNLLGVNGVAAQQQAAQGIIGASTGAVQQSNINVLNSLFGGGFGPVAGNQQIAAQAPTAPSMANPMNSYNQAKSTLQAAQQAAQQNPNNPQAQQALQQASQQWQTLNTPEALSSLVGSNQAFNQANNQYQQQLSAFNQQQSQMGGQQQAGTGSSPFANLLNRTPEQYAQGLTQTGIGLAESATDAFRNNTIVQQSLNAMNQLGGQAVQNSAAARGMLNSGNTLSELYNQGQAIAGQYLIPQITSLSNNIIGNVGSAGNAMLSAQQGLAGGITSSMLGANTSMAQNAMGNQLSGLQGLVGQGLNSAQTQAGVLTGLGGAVAGQNTNMANTQSNAILSNAQQQANALQSNAQLQLSAAQANLRPSQGGILEGLGSAFAGAAAGTGLMAAMMI